MTAVTGRQTVTAVLVAGGSGQRLGAAVPKAFVEVGGRALVQHAAELFISHRDVRRVVVVAPADRVAEAGALVPNADVVAGGATRQASVAAGLEVADGDLVLVHDVARPFTPPSVISAVVAALRAGADAVVPVVPVHDTIRRVNADGQLAGLVDRAALAAVQTPQGFRRAVLVIAHERRADDATRARLTDDAGLVEALGVPVVAVPGADASFKITTPADLLRAASMTGLRSAVIGPTEGVT